MNSFTSIFQHWFATLPFMTGRGTHLPSAAVASILLAIVLITVSLSLLFVLKKSNSRIWKLLNNNLTLLFVVAWLMGFVVYDVGMCTGARESLLFNAPMAVLHAFGMFVLDSDVSEIQEQFHSNWVYMGAFSAAHFLAALVSMVFVIEHFGYHIIAGFKMFFEAYFKKAKKETFIFWGLNDASMTLADSIKHDADPGNSYRIIFVRTNNDRGGTSARNGMERLFHFLSLKNEDLNKLQQLRCLTTNTFVNSTRLGSGIEEAKPDILREELSLKWLAQIIGKKTTGTVHLFFLSDDSLTNIKAVTALKRDKTITGACQVDDLSSTSDKQSRNIIFYCHARDNSMNRVMEDFDLSSNIEVRIVDSAHLAIEELKREPDYQPINLVEIDTEKNYGTVRSAFNSLVVGFGATGKDALRFLYEFGAFVDSSSSGEDIVRSPFHCHVVDKQMTDIQGPFVNSAPALFANRNKSDGKPLVELHDMDYNSDEFYNGLFRELAPQLNYVLIAIGEDEAGMTLAIRMLRHFRRIGRDFSRLRIFVRSYMTENYSYMQKVADHYNEGEKRIIIFGQKQETYSYHLIVKDEFRKRGEHYYDSYRALYPQNDSDGTWRQRQRKLRGLVTLTKSGVDPKTGCHTFDETRLTSPKPASLNKLQTLRRKETQDKANALHEATKIKILEQVIPNWYSTLVPKIFDFVETDTSMIIRVKRVNNAKDNPKVTTYPELNEKEQLIMDNLAHLEHIRWNASHEVLGYTALEADYPGEHACVEDRMMHNCLVDWDELDKESDLSQWVEDYKVYDYGVVETTIDIHRRANDPQSQN